jgi:hypothetical protein
VQDLERLLGNDAVQLGGEGLRRKRLAQQQPLFKEEPADSEPPAEAIAEAQMDDDTDA